MPNLVTFLNQTPKFRCYAVRFVQRLSKIVFVCVCIQRFFSSRRLEQRLSNSCWQTWTQLINRQGWTFVLLLQSANFKFVTADLFDALQSLHVVDSIVNMNYALQEDY